MNTIKAQAGPQEEFLSCTADIAFYGGSAGGGARDLGLTDKSELTGKDGAPLTQQTVIVLPANNAED